MRAEARLLRQVGPTGLRALFAPRVGGRVFGVGAAKTGTHSLAEMFAGRVASAHERDAESLIELLLDAAESGDRSRLRRYLRLRDRARRLTIDASQVNIYLLDELEALFPGSRYVLTVRPPAAWLRSIIDDSLRRSVSPTWIRFRRYRFGDGAFAPEEEALRARDLFTLEGYLSYWRRSVDVVTERLPTDRLLIVETKDLAPRREEIGAFCGLPGGHAEAAAAHAFANPTRSGVLGEIDRAFLLGALERICGPLNERHFPNRPLGEQLDAVLR